MTDAKTPVPTVQLDELTLSETSEVGGQARVSRISSHPGLMAKMYHDVHSGDFAPLALSRLVQARGAFRLDGEQVDSWAAWPIALILDGRNVVGFTMGEAPRNFFVKVFGSPQLANLSLLASHPAAAWDTSVLPTRREKVAILTHLAGVLQNLHHRNCVVGDLSFTNILWSVSPTPRVMLLDCDGIRVGGDPATLPQGDSPDWEDPRWPGASQNAESDDYKLSLAIVRVLNLNLSERPSPTTDLAPDELGGAHAGLVELVRLAGSKSGRSPTAGTWKAALEGRTWHSVESRTTSRPRVSVNPDTLVQRGQARAVRPVRPPT